MRLILLAVTLLAFGNFSAIAADAQAMDDLRVLLGSNLRQGKVEETRAYALEVFQRTATDGRGISEAAYALARRKAQARSRSAAISAIMAHDLDGDGTVTRAELDQVFAQEASQVIHQQGVELIPTPAQQLQVRDKLVGQVLVMDRNGDGVIGLADVIAHHEAQAGGRDHQVDRPISLGLDRDGDGLVTREEFLISVDQILSAWETSGDGSFSQPEIQAVRPTLTALRQQQRERREAERLRHEGEKRARECGIPAIPSGAHVSVIGTRGPAALTNIQIGDDTQAVGTVLVHIQEGVRPLYIVLTSLDRVVWQLTGATARVAAVVLGGGSDAERPPMAGVMGVPRALVHTMSKTACTGGVAVDGAAGNAERQLFTSLLGRAPDVINGRTSLTRATLPVGTTFSLEHPAAAAEPDDVKAREIYTHIVKDKYKAGLVRLNPAEVVSQHPVTAHDTWPGIAGMMPLVERGDVTIAKYIRVMMLGSTKVIGGAIVMSNVEPSRTWQVPRMLRITAPIRLPPAFSGTGVTVVVAPGVPMPDNVPDDGMVTCESTEKPAPAGTICP